MESQKICSREYFWLRTGGRRIIVGITSQLLRLVGDVSAVKLPARGVFLNEGAGFVEICSSEGIFSLASPLTGRIVEVNWELSRQPELLTSACDSWLAIFIQQARHEEEDFLARE